MSAALAAAPGAELAAQSVDAKPYVAALTYALADLFRVSNDLVIGVRSATATREALVNAGVALPPIPEAIQRELNAAGTLASKIGTIGIDVLEGRRRIAVRADGDIDVEGREGEENFGAPAGLGFAWLAVTAIIAVCIYAVNLIRGQETRLREGTHRMELEAIRQGHGQAVVALRTQRAQEEHARSAGTWPAALADFGHSAAQAATAGFGALPWIIALAAGAFALWKFTESSGGGSKAAA